MYLSRTYRNMCPYLKGIHQTLDSWRAGRDKDSWKLNRRELLAAITSNYEEVILDNEKEAPIKVKPASRLQDDLDALDFLLEGPISKRVSVRVKNSGFVHYGIGDASGNGYGAAIHIGGDLHFRYGQWSSRESEETSNYREFSNLVNAVEKLYGEGHLKNYEIFLHTDSLVTDCAY